MKVLISLDDTQFVIPFPERPADVQVVISDLFPTNGVSVCNNPISSLEMKPISLAPLDSCCILCQLSSQNYQEDKEIGNHTPGRKQFLRSMTCKDEIKRTRERLQARNAKSPDNLMAILIFKVTKHKAFLK